MACPVDKAPPRDWVLQVKPLPLGVYLRDGLHHRQAHHNGADRVIFTVIWQTADTVITVSQNLDPQLVVLLLKHTAR